MVACGARQHSCDFVIFRSPKRKKATMAKNEFDMPPHGLASLPAARIGPRTMSAVWVRLGKTESGVGGTAEEGGSKMGADAGGGRICWRAA